MEKIKMVARVLPYADAVIKLAPSYDKFKSLEFILLLLAETVLRFSKMPPHALDWITVAKALQITACLKLNPASSSYKVTIPTMALTIITPLALSGMVNLSTIRKVDVEKGNKKISVPMVSIQADRPPFVSFLGCSQEIVNIASKVIQSLVAGLVAQQVFTDGHTTGKIRTVVSATLLGLSALNIYCSVGEITCPE